VAAGEFGQFPVGEGEIRVGDERPLNGTSRSSPYTPAMRRWVCIIALLAGFSADGYAWSVRPRTPVAIERQLDAPVGGLSPTAAWWARS